MSRIERALAFAVIGASIFAAAPEEPPDLAAKFADSASKQKQRFESAVKEAGERFDQAAKQRDDDVAARRAFRIAGAGYTKVEMLHGETPKIRLMEGNCWLLSGNPAFAIFCYRCGLEGDPYDAELQRGLEYARTIVPYANAEDREAFTPRLSFLQRVRLFAHRWAVVLAAVFGGIGWYCLSRWIVTRKPWVLMIAAAGLLATGAVATNWFVDHSNREQNLNTNFAVLRKSGVLRSGDGPSFPPVRESALPPGLEAKLLQTGAWDRIELADGTVGWIPADNVGRVTKGHSLMGP